MPYKESWDASDYVQECYKDYSIYVNKDRACPSIYDGFKMVQRRIIYTASQLPEKLMKSSSLCGRTMLLHPHGDSYGALVNMSGPTCSFPLFTTQGNFGSWGAFGGAAASRYTEIYLSKIARFIYCQFLEYAPMVQGETGLMEPEYLPCLVNYGLVAGSSGIGVGLSSDIVPLNLMDIIGYYESYIQNDYKFDHSKTPRPDFRYVMIDMDDNECRDNVLNYRGSFPIRSIVEQESDNVFVIRSLYNRRIEKVLDKLRGYLDSDQVDFRNESATRERYVFEVVDFRVDKEQFKKDLEKATCSKSSFNRVMTMNDVSIYSSLDYCIKNQIEKLNLAIDKKIETEMNRAMQRSELLRALAFYKKNHTFDKIGQKSSEDLIVDMMNLSDKLKKVEKIDFTESLGLEILKKPISYLTRDHDKELEDLNREIDDLKSHDRKSYLLDLYKQLRDMVKDIYEERYHSLLRSQILTSPRVSFSNDHKSLIVSGGRKGIKFHNYVWIIDKSSHVYKRSISLASSSEVPLDIEDPVAIISDYDRWIEIICNDDTGLGFDTESYKYDKQIINLDKNQYVSRAVGYLDGKQPDYLPRICRSKISKSVRYK